MYIKTAYKGVFHLANHTHQISLTLPQASVWAFIQDMDHWAPLIPGYLAHEMVSENEVTWVFEADLGFMKKPVKLKIDITERQEPTNIQFKLEGLSDNFTGGGHFDISEIDRVTSSLEGYLDISSGGLMGAMMNPILKTFVPKTIEELTNNIGVALTNNLSVSE
ncbi:MAG: SRPBCC family protein [Kurthia sp.]|nr:SRPBCC family protein [Candidatus Kurthia equi]